jgi:ABC-type lipoprotein release transport system permease subunit
MLKNYFLVALRNFWRNKTFSLINILGLSIGISASLVIFLLVWHDLSFDKFEPHGDRIYRVVGQNNENGKLGYQSVVPVPMAEVIQKEIAGIELVAPIHTMDPHPNEDPVKVSVPYPTATQPRILKAQNDFAATDARLLDLLGYTWLIGSPTTALSQPYQVVLTERNAHLYFPGLAYNEIVGKTLKFNDTLQATITGIVKDIKENTDFYFGTFLSRATLMTGPLKQDYFQNWGWILTTDQLFVRLTPGTSAASLTPLLTKILRKYEDPQFGHHTTILLQPLNDLHFDTCYGGFEEGRTGHKPTLYALAAIAAFLLLLACINFINLTTAQAAQRAKEIGIRKTMGSQRTQLALQFLNETFLLTVMATALSVALTPLLLKLFADFVPADFHLDLFQPGIIIFLLILILAVSLLSGFYPALVMSAFKPIAVLKNQSQTNSTNTRTAWFRHSLTVSQFVIAQVFIIATLLVGKQISYALSMDMGFRKTGIVSFTTNRSQPPHKKNTLAAELQRIPGIQMVSVCSAPPSARGGMGTDIAYNNGKRDFKAAAGIKQGDSNYVRLFDLRLLAGTGLPQNDTISNAVVITQTLARNLGFQKPQTAIGKKIVSRGPATIVGVVADFHQHSIHEPIQPTLIANGTKDAAIISIALQPSDNAAEAWPATIAQIEKAFKTIYPNDDFNYTFEDETIAKFYTIEQYTARLLNWATGLIIFISSIGLFGLVIYITNQRTKEIGIRKVMGASVSRIVTLLSKDFLKPIVIAILIALPIAWWAGNKWLERFAYKTTLSWWIFIAGGGILLLVAFTVLGLRTIKAARANPVDALRSE